MKTISDVLQNIAKAQKEIDRLEADANAEGSSKPAEKTNGHAAGGAEQENGDAEATTDELEKIRIEDAGAPES